MNKKHILVRVAALVVALSVAGCGPQSESPVAGPGGDPRSLRDKPAPAFALTMFDGQTVRLADLTGQVAVLHFWSSSFPLSSQSLSHLQRLHADASLSQKGLRVLTVHAREGKDRVQGFLRRCQCSVPSALDTEGAVMARFRVQTTPVTVIIGRQGIVESVFVGYGPGSDRQLDWAIQAALKGG